MPLRLPQYRKGIEKGRAVSSENFPKLIAERYAYWSEQGMHGKALFEALANDPEIPFMLQPELASVVVGSSPGAMKQMRARGTGPAFLRQTGKIVSYTRPDLFQFLARRYVSRAA